MPKHGWPVKDLQMQLKSTFKAFKMLPLWTWLFVALILLLPTFTKVISPHFIINYTASLPVGIYFREPIKGKVLQRGDIVEISQEGKLGLYAGNYHILPKGYSFIKIVYGLPGDTYESSSGTLLLNGLPFGPILKSTSTGIPLPQKLPGEHTIPTDYILPLTPSQSSFDGRYYGSIPISFIKYRLHAVFTFRSEEL